MLLALFSCLGAYAQEEDDGWLSKGKGNGHSNGNGNGHHNHGNGNGHGHDHDDDGPAAPIQSKTLSWVIVGAIVVVAIRKIK